MNTLRYADRVKELRAKPDIKLGQGNLNLNFEKKEKLGMPEDLATIMMMPRQHNNTIKYEVDNNMQKIRKLKTVKAKNKKTPSKNENNVFNNNYNGFNGFNNMGMENNNNANNGLNFFNNFPPLLSNNNINNNYHHKMNNMNNVNNNQAQPQVYQNQQNVNINQTDLLPNDIDVNSIIKMSGMKNNPNSTNIINQNIINPNTAVYPPKNLNNLFNNCNEQQIPYSYTENKENLQNNNNNYTEETNSKNKDNSSLKKEVADVSNKISEKKYVSKNSGSIGFAFLNDYTSFNNKEKKNKSSNKKKNAELIELKEKYEKIVNDILNEEKTCLENHKSHIDDMVLTMKNEMNLINIVEQKSNVDQYVDEILNIFGQQENKIQAMKQKLLGFKRLLKEENELSQKISFLKENNNININKNNCNDETEEKCIKLEEENDEN